ncbi:unnamed protein product [Vicia faba]|uniref:Uncharacterized protein n=1 Tax=Vicia faba TaxID=3906 RepID=A0AAV0ZPK8_VICFA|nr:unnamed protein product [Vicia faba]
MEGTLFLAFTLHHQARVNKSCLLGNESEEMHPTNKPAWADSHFPHSVPLPFQLVIIYIHSPILTLSTTLISITPFLIHMACKLGVLTINLENWKEWIQNLLPCLAV